ncbi:DUF805 domain-containing protein [Porphyrobacter algicida]|uniref:DUF805 domain-containing protein n=1 Tax=Qipengyuania algicida TaxID=1836209 RepID=A0A845AJ20_9SPHN|nr:DUF805 domain-containing protein [Qipengyuania algicida]MXP29604.1 DUF805 domain-containing protein [Qipengyuania algicida]
MPDTVTIREHFKRLADFSGREDRASFWPYAAVAFAIIMVVGMIIFVPMMMSAMQEMQQFAAQHPEQVSVTSGPSQYSISVRGDPPELMPKESILLYLVATFGLAFVLYAAAVVRRLRDRGKSGLWGFMPFPFIIYSSIQVPRMFSSIGPGAQSDMTLFFSIFFSNLLYIITMIWLIVLLAGQSAPERDGE